MTVADIQNKYKLMYQGMVDKNADILREVLDDSFVLVHMTGIRQPKNSFISAVLDGTLNYYSAVHDSYEVTMLSETVAQLDGKSRVSAAVFGGGKHTWRLGQVLTLVYDGEDWKITEAVASTY